MSDNDKRETHAAVIAEYRADADKMDARALYQPTTEYVRKLLDRLEAAHERELLTKPAENVNGGAASDSRDNSGNAAKLRGALEKISLLSSAPPPHWKPIAVIVEIGKLADAALALPRRNCEVGTPQEQAKRFEEFCASHHRPLIGGKIPTGPCDCPCYERNSCNYFVWAQMPYEAQEGGAK